LWTQLSAQFAFAASPSHKLLTDLANWLTEWRASQKIV
jgi:hypothetical protein